jgi:hypothetical protein
MLSYADGGSQPLMGTALLTRPVPLPLADAADEAAMVEPKIRSKREGDGGPALFRVFARSFAMEVVHPRNPSGELLLEPFAITSGLCLLLPLPSAPAPAPPPPPPAPAPPKVGTALLLLEPLIESLDPKDTFVKPSLSWPDPLPPSLASPKLPGARRASSRSMLMVLVSWCCMK